MKRGAGGAGSSPSSGKDRWADFGFSTPPRGSGRVAVRTETAPSARGGGSRKDRGTDDEEEDRGRGATGGSNDDDAGSESTPGKKVGRTKSQDAATKARNQAKYNLERYSLKSAGFKIYREFFVYDQEQCKGVKQVEDIAVCKLCYNKTNKDFHLCEIAGGKGTSTNRKRHLEKHHEEEFMEQIREVGLSKVSGQDGEQLITGFFSPGPLASERQTLQADFDMKMCAYFVKKLVPMRHADCKEFNEMIEAAGKAGGGTSKIKVMHRETLRTRLLEILQLVREKIAKLTEGQFISLGFDCWTSANGETFIASKMHWIPETWEKLMSSIVSVDKVEGKMCAEDIVRITSDFIKKHLSSVG